ncbi:MAG TPA: MFS transporter, partial [Gaiellaceae bacterium]|nr:MFS transporter [Gaiellaceae bacterium]
ALATVLLSIKLSGRREDLRKEVRVDLAGAFLCASGLGLLVAGFIEQPSLGWADPLVPGGIAGGLLLLAAFVVYEMRTPMPMLPLQLFRKRNFSVTNIETLLVYGGLSGLSVFLSLFLLEFAGYSPFRAGLATLPITVVMFFLSRFAGRLSMQYGPHLFMAIGPIVAGVSLVALARLPARLDYWVDLLPPLLGFSVGLSMTVAPLTTTVLSDAGPGDAGIASGVNNAVARVAGLIAVAVLGIAAAGGGDHLTKHGFHQAMLVVSALLVAGGLIGAVGIRNPKPA